MARIEGCQWQMNIEHKGSIQEYDPDWLIVNTNQNMATKLIASFNVNE